MDDNAGAKLHPSGENFHHALLDAATGIAITGIDGRFLEANTAYCRMLGYTEDELRSLDFLTLTHPDDQASNRALITELVQGLRLNFVLEKRYLTKGGQVVWCRVSVAAQRDAEGRAQKIIGIAEDITQQRAAEAERNAVLAKSAALVTALGQVVYDRHPLNDSVDWSGRLTEVLGCSPKQMGTVADWAARVHPDDLAEAVAAIEAAVRQRHNYDLEYRFRHQDGHYLWMNDRGVVITQADGSSRIVGVLVDITGRKREAEALVTAHEQLAQRSQLMNMALRVARMGGWWRSRPTRPNTRPRSAAPFGPAPERGKVMSWRPKSSSTGAGSGAAPSASRSAMSTGTYSGSRAPFRISAPKRRPRPSSAGFGSSPTRCRLSSGRRRPTARSIIPTYSFLNIPACRPAPQPPAGGSRVSTRTT